MSPRERDLLLGMCRCYAACHEDFDETLRMVSSSRGMSKEEALNILRSISKKYKDDNEYIELRSKLPADFPI